MTTPSYCFRCNIIMYAVFPYKRSRRNDAFLRPESRNEPSVIGCRFRKRFVFLPGLVFLDPKTVSNNIFVPDSSSLDPNDGFECFRFSGKNIRKRYRFDRSPLEFNHDRINFKSRPLIFSVRPHPTPGTFELILLQQSPIRKSGWNVVSKFRIFSRHTFR